MEEPKTIRILDFIRFIVNAILMIPLVLLDLLCSILMTISTILKRVLHHIGAYWIHVASRQTYLATMEGIEESWGSNMETLDKLYHRF